MKSLWIDYTENPEAISSLYSSAEPLCNVTPYKLILEQTPLEASLYLFVNTPPDRPTTMRCFGCGLIGPDCRGAPLQRAAGR